MSKNRCIGRAGTLPWNMPADMKFFRDKTRGHACIMGRKTLDALRGKPLPNRPNIVITRQTGYKAAEGVVVAPTIERALEIARSIEKEEIFVIGGAEIYTLALPYSDRIYLTHIDCVVDHGDAFFPELPSTWKVVATDPRPADEKHAHPYDFKIYEKV